MDPRRFDAMTRHLGVAGSRRRVLTTLVGGTFGLLLARLGAKEGAGACKKVGKPCERSSDCCLDARCKGGTCRCTGHSDCDDAAKPCCIKGKCKPTCNGVCCVDCFVQVDPETGNKVDGTEVCCPANSICGHKKPGPGDDRCCYGDDDEVCVKGKVKDKCCCHECLGSRVCGGKCCAQDACCDGKCCKKGEVCAGDPPKCVSANRACGQGQGCKDGESCVGGKCCTDLRICGDGVEADFCCKAGTYCEFKDTPLADCCPINTGCGSTFRQHRVRR